MPAMEGAAPNVGTNLDPLKYYSTATAPLDAMKASGEWLTQRPGKWNTNEKLNLDQHGWVKSLPDDQLNLGMIVIRENGEAADPGARYVVLYEGEGAISGMLGTSVVNRNAGRMLVKADREGFVHLKITETDPRGNGNYIRNVRVVREEYFPAYQSGQLFNPEYLEKLRGFNVLRFMDWMVTNTIFKPDGTSVNSSKPHHLLGAGLLDWADRPRMQDARWDRGVPVEAMVHLANELDADPWFNMPINASDDYVRGFARYVKEHLEPGRKVHVELSNEVWNWGFRQAHYARAQAEREWGEGANYMEWYGKRTAQVGEIWNREFGEPVTGSGDPGRVSIVYSTQFHWKGLEKAGLDTKNWKDSQGRHRRAADYFDEYGVASYYTGGLHEPENASKVMGWWRLADGGYKRAIDALWKEFDDTQRTLYPYHGGQAARYGLNLVTYEAGYGALTPYKQHKNQRYTDFLVKLQRRPEIYDIDMANAQAFADAGGTLFVNFGIIGKPSKFGSWAALESIKQDSSPRYRALQELIRRSATGEPAEKYEVQQVSVDCRVRLIKSLAGAWDSGVVGGGTTDCSDSTAN